jgi:hypothetical protein
VGSQQRFSTRGQCNYETALLFLPLVTEHDNMWWTAACAVRFYRHQESWEFVLAGIISSLCSQVKINECLLGSVVMTWQSRWHYTLVRSKVLFLHSKNTSGTCVQFVVVVVPGLTGHSCVGTGICTHSNVGTKILESQNLLGIFWYQNTNRCSSLASCFLDREWFVDQIC